MAKHAFTVLAWFILLLSVPLAVLAKNIHVTPDDDLQASLNRADDGDVVIIAAGEYIGNFIVNQGITVSGEIGSTAGETESLAGANRAVINANGVGHGIELRNSNITIKNLTIINWGRDLTEQDSGIYTDKKSTNITVQDNTLTGDGFGIWVQRSQDVLIKHNRISGNAKLRTADRGNGIQLSMVTKALVEGNTVSETRDGLYVISSQDNELRNNTLHDLRFGVHYMYSHNNKVVNNFSYNARVGYALMSSRKLIVSGNRSLNTEDYGFLLNFITFSEISNNHVKDVWTKPENKVLGRDGKGLFIYNSGYNTIKYNTVDTAEIGIHLTAGSENVKVYGNNFINNPIQVKYVSNKRQEWSVDGIGNYWSNYLGWDLNGDGKGDTAFEPNDGIDKMVWEYPEAKVLLDSPAVLLLRWVQNQFPILKPGGVKDSHPLMMQSRIASIVDSGSAAVNNDSLTKNIFTKNSEATDSL
ncbi:nitrous oxide reductase family maturation protein NosD [Moritella sp. Urea-trap-13]|uniref:nitrous oxide reductase family maturation protein NosD n=1 Tax=Moritella sp. Urea-trap-13 TaxID=2058327 RepID=UPI000C3288B2|nr:nitrous oxide reductase family maturation protein NosD [Moritella sp. Urea-trap-13]PKH07089.1 copper-binding protein [Moritella sp. Urea-trap-13]